MVSDLFVRTRGWVRRVLILVLMEYGLWPLYSQLPTPPEPVLILVLMEYGLWHKVVDTIVNFFCVLILVLMEYGLWHLYLLCSGSLPSVLILVLMEYGLWLDPRRLTRAYTAGLNPCSNGIWSLTNLVLKLLPLLGLNPCSNGIWSLTKNGSGFGRFWAES